MSLSLFRGFAMTRGYMYHKNGDEQRDRVWFAGRIRFEPAFCDFDRPLTANEIVSVHIGHGIWGKYVVDEVDNKTALLRAT